MTIDFLPSVAGDDDEQITCTFVNLDTQEEDNVLVPIGQSFATSTRSYPGGTRLLVTATRTTGRGSFSEVVREMVTVNSGLTVPLNIQSLNPDQNNNNALDNDDDNTDDPDASAD